MSRSHRVELQPTEAERNGLTPKRARGWLRVTAKFFRALCITEQNACQALSPVFRGG